jgi:O-acetylserine/cysteine efflux transporter
LSFKDTFLAAIVPIFLGFGFVIAKPAFEYFPPLLLMGLRFTIAAMIMIWWFPIPKKFLKQLFFVSLVANTIQYSLTYSGLNLIDASAAVLIVMAEVPFGIIAAYFLLKEKPGVKSIIGILIAFFGVYTLSGSPNLEGKFFGILLVLFGAATWGFGQVLAKPLTKKMNPIALAAWLCLMSGPILIVLSAIFEGNTFNYFYSANLTSWLIAGYLGVIMQPISYGCWYYVLKKNPVYKVMPIVTFGIPLTGFLAAVFLLGEKPTTELFVGGAIILFGVAVISFFKEK